MALVRTFNPSACKGATVNVYDKYVKCSEEEMARRRASFDRTVHRVIGELKAEGRMPTPRPEDFLDYEEAPK